MAKSNKSTWIWYPGDYEIWLGNAMNSRRTERGAFFPPFWKMDSHYVTVEFSKKLELDEPEEVYIAAEGKFNIKLDGKLQFGMPSRFLIPAGSHSLNIKVWNQATPPALYVDGPTIHTDGTWRVTYEDKEWIDESGKASDTSATLYMDAGHWNFQDPKARPSAFRLECQPQQPVEMHPVEGGTLYDFGRETFGYVVLHDIDGEGYLNIYYGESPEEALDTEHCETLDRLLVEPDTITDLSVNERTPRGPLHRLQGSRAFRYVYVTTGADLGYGSLSMLYEFLPEQYRGAFRCSDPELNRIWDIGAYTLHLTTREFFIDGIKRDRWVWSGDAVQSYLMNYYLFFDSDTVKRTIWLLRGKDPVSSHTNTIMDYTFFWFLSIYDYYIYTGDRQFVAQVYPRMRSMMDFVLGRTNPEGMVEGQTGDWVFVDWADGYLDKHGALSFEQVLFCRSLETTAHCARLAGADDDARHYEELAAALRDKLLPTFWSETRHALVHNSIDGRQSDVVTRYANMFAVFFGYLSDRQRADVKQHVLLNDEVMHITTPYMRFYELEALCELGEQERVMHEMKAYWGGMLREGATSFWEKYNPQETGTQHLAMYGRPYGKSLCHAWGASPIYLLGKYYLGVRPVSPGYEEVSVTPVLGGLEWMEGTVPTPKGDIRVHMDRSHIRLSLGGSRGWLTVSASALPESSHGQMEPAGPGRYRLWVDTDEEITITYIP